MTAVQKILADVLKTDAREAVDQLIAARDGLRLSQQFGSGSTSAGSADWATLLSCSSGSGQAGESPMQVAKDLRARNEALADALNSWHPDRWQLGFQLGQGGSGLAFEVKDTRLGPVAIKFTRDPKSQQKPEREAAMMSRVAHEHVCKLFEHKMLAGGLHAMVLEYLSHGSLAELIQDSPDGRVREFEVARILSI